MSFNSIIVSTCAYALFTATFTSYAATTYVYTGNLFDQFSQPSSYDASMSVSATIVLDTHLKPNMSDVSVIPTSFKLTDGLYQITDANAYPYMRMFQFSTDSESVITEWIVGATTPPNEFNAVDDQYTDISTGGSYLMPWSGVDRAYHVTCLEWSSDGFTCVTGIRESAVVAAAAGSWTVVPVPAAIWLFGSGLLGLIGVARRKVRV